MESNAGLPNGIQKEILREAPTGNLRKAEAGDEVAVHYVGRLLDGTEFDSSRKQNEPYIFTLGHRRVIKGWDFGLATMRRGEVAKFTIDPAYAYGPSGVPPKIPPKATLVYEVELLGWPSEFDIYGDEGVVVTESRYGSGATPQAGDEVMLTLKAQLEDGTVTADFADFEYVIGSDKLGTRSKTFDKVLCDMQAGGWVKLKLSSDYAFVHNWQAQSSSCTVVNLSLLDICQTTDLSFGMDNSVTKKRVKQGTGDSVPTEGSKVALLVVNVTDGHTTLPNFVPKVLNFTAGNGEVCDALELATTSMTKAERAVVTVETPDLFADEQLGVGELSLGKVVITIVLQDFQKMPELSSMDEDERLYFAAARKDVGATLFKKGRFKLALQLYKRIGRIFDQLENFKGDRRTKAKELKGQCELNQAACHLKLGEYSEACSACKTVLKSNPQNVKARYRLAQAEFELGKLDECISNCKQVIELDRHNKDARHLFKQALARRKKEDAQSQGMFESMCKALGKGPIPETVPDEVPDNDESLW